MKTTQNVIAISGVKNSGKTTLIEKLIRELALLGISTATIKHDGHRFDPDRPGTDSFRHLAAGAVGTAVFDGEKYQLVKYQAVSEEELLSFFPEADLILLEGFKHSPWPKLEIIRKGVSDGQVCDRDKLLAIATDLEGFTAGVPVLDLNNAKKIAEFIFRCIRSERK